MEFRENFDNHVKSLVKFSNMNFNEEQTKMALIVPFIKMLGYDVYNPLEVIPEFICDIGEKKGEKVDYAISINGAIELLIETKPMSDLLINHDIQLTRYFNVTNAKVGILTNGVIYKFFTDLDEKNRLDSKPFLEVNMLNITDSQIVELRKFHKKNFDVDIILSSAEILKYSNGIKKYLKKQLDDIDDDFVKLLMKEVYDKKITQNRLEEFRDIVSMSFRAFINENIRKKLENALEQNKEQEKSEIEDSPEVPDSGIITTEDEKEAFYIVKSVLGKAVDINDITYKDTKSYFGILYQNNTRKWICRIIFNENDLTVVFPNAEEKRGEEKIRIETLQNLYDLEKKLLNAVNMYVEKTEN